MRLLTLFLLLPFALVSAQSARIRDSSGVRIVENPGLSTALVAFRIDAVPLLRLGGLGSPSEFDDGLAPRQLLRLHDGKFVTVERSRLRVWDSSGRPVRTVGREGGGPGEYRRIGFACLLADGRLRIVDPGQGRLTVLTTAFQIDSSRGIPSGDAGEGCLIDGSHVVHKRTGALENGVRHRGLLRISVFGDSIPVVGRFVDPPLQLYPKRLIVAALPDGFIVGTGETAELRFHHRDGRLRQIVRFDEPVRGVTSREAESSHPGFVVGLQRSGNAAREQRPAVPRGTWPVFTSVQVAPDGLIWINNSPRSDEREWYAITADGRLVGRLPRPPKQGEDQSQPRFGGGSIDIAWVDAVGSPHISRFRLTRLP